MADTKWSQFPSVIPDNSDTVVGLHAGENVRFTIANLVAAVRQGLANIFVPKTDIGAANGVAGLDNTGKVPSAQLPAIASTAADVIYDNTTSGLQADDVQEALDELAAGAGGSTASTTTYDNTDSGLSATNVQDAIDEIVNDLDDKADQSDVDEKADQATVAPRETTTTATAAHDLGTIFYLNGVLCRALADIAIGDTINTAAGGNATQTTVGENFSRIVKLTSAQYAQLSAAEIAADIVYIVTDQAVDYVTPDMIAWPESGTTASRAYSIGEYFTLGGKTCRAKTAIASGATLTLNTNYEEVPGGGLNSVAKQTVVKQKTVSGSISTGLNEWTVAVDPVSGYSPVGIVGVQFAAIARDKITLSQFYIDGTNILLSCVSTVTYASGRNISVWVLYQKD